MNLLPMTGKLRSCDLVPFAFDKSVRYAPVSQDLRRQCRDRRVALERDFLERTEHVQPNANADHALAALVYPVIFMVRRRQTFSAAAVSFRTCSVASAHARSCSVLTIFGRGSGGFGAGGHRCVTSMRGDVCCGADCAAHPAIASSRMRVRMVTAGPACWPSPGQSSSLSGR